MTPEIFIKRQCKAKTVQRASLIQSLWSGYGEVARYSLTGLNAPSFVIAKHCTFPSDIKHPRGWHSNVGHARKVRSYEVEQNWYQHWSSRCNPLARIPHCYGSFHDEHTGQRLTLLEDLDAAGYSDRYTGFNIDQILACIQWLANFHAGFIHLSPNASWPQGLWKKGTYWHLDTRPDEWAAMAEGELKKNASKLTHFLDNARYKTLVHGDAKVANFCISPLTNKVAAVDFQYVGGGVGVQDLVYFLGSALSEKELIQHSDYLLSHYFAELSSELMAQGESQALAHAVVEEWQCLFTIAWADFHRFILGWSPTHPKNTLFSQQLTAQALEKLKHMA
ncbi:DUF1679 domain-containing protein [Marinomonas sp. A79]|uniref:DUF1679 domain-containing protein n=1 Tax=Marinomonas vulgaris TaxID=2823372 RepID=A0ABS5HCV3_9GAMM|nr:oxidoreductase family protein [Marinomonas vulgaris]MBR7889482.1 DUF1679 domain-containing protein [Marinomonas vulgaris]